MILKKSYLVNLRENMKRRAWVFWSVFLLFFCYYPGFIMISLNRFMEEGEFLLQEELLNKVNDFLFTLFDINYFNIFMVIFMAVIIGIQGFQYLYDKKQINFFHSQPVTRNRRFLVLWSNGIFIFLAAYTVNMVAGLLVSNIYVADNGKLIGIALQSYGLNILLFLSIYHLTLISVMLTGHILVSILAIIIFFVYEFALRGVIYLYSSLFFYTYDNRNAYGITETIFSPIVLVINYINNRYNTIYWKAENDGNGEVVFTLLFLSIIFGLIAFILYKKRPSESYGKSIAFSKIKQPVKIAILFLAGLYAALLFYIAAGNSVAFAIIGAVFIILLGHAAIQIIYDSDFNAIRKNFFSAFIVIAATVAFFLVYKYDITSYDSRFPKMAKVEAVGVELVTENKQFMQWLMEDGREIWGNEYSRNMMRLTNLEPVYNLLYNMEEVDEVGNTDNSKFYHFNISFYLKNGKVEYRRFFLDYEKNMEALNEIYHMEEYRNVTEQVLQNDFIEKYKIFNVVYDNGLKESVLNKEEKIKKLLDAYKKDLKASRYEDVFGEIPIGCIRFEGIGLTNSSHTNYWVKPVFPSYYNTIELLEKEGISLQAKFDLEEAMDKIENITISMSDENMWEWKPYEEMDQYTKKVIYRDKNKIKAILEYGIPQECIDWISGPVYTEEQYNIYVKKSIKGEDKEIIRGDVDYIEEVITYRYVFEEGNVPQFVIDNLNELKYGEAIEY